MYKKSIHPLDQNLIILKKISSPNEILNTTKGLEEVRKFK